MQFIVNRLFIEINISQSSVATYAKNGRIFNNQLAANLPRNLPVKTLRKSVKIWQNYGHEFVASLFWPTLYKVLFRQNTFANCNSVTFSLNEQC